MQRRLKKSVVYVLYGLGFVFMLVGLLIISKNKIGYSSDYEISGETENDINQYVSKIITDTVEDMPVVSENKTDIIKRPYNNNNITIVKNYYNVNDDEETQQNSLLFYGDTYIQSSGVSYGLDEQFEVLSILNGKVTDIKEDDILGNVITIEHDNDIISVYQSVTDILVKVGDEVNQGDVIAKSSTSNIATDLGNHLYFELIINGVNVDPEDYFDRNINEM
ncbi:MAG: M23 family metallopeptidase [Bacilli bacterium]|nr:M23 family metallopeptidase [Bacilli bacterium]